jgi:hypothetical protein
VAIGLVHGDPCFNSCGVITSDPYIKWKGVNPVALDSVMFNAHMTSGSWSAHLPFCRQGAFFDRVEDLIVGTFDYTVGLWVVYRGEHCLRFDGAAEFSKVLVVELLAVIDC